MKSQKLKYNNSEWDTPETDAKASNIIGFYSCATVPAEFARELERDLQESTSQFIVLRSVLIELEETVKQRIKEHKDEINTTNSYLTEIFSSLKHYK